ncbi:MAG: hypothetical protein ACXWFN_11210, partial [Solirubrobacterales bacterium]
MAKKRASMREGPLADLFRSTDESVSVEEEVAVTAGANGVGSGVDVALAESEQVEREEIQVERVAPEPATDEQALVEEHPAPVPEPEPAAPEPQPEPAPEPAAEVMLDPHKDPAVKDVERRETRALRVNEEVEVEHEGLKRLMGTDNKQVRPAFGRNEPDTARYATVPRTHQAVLRVVGVGGAGVNAVNRMVEAEVGGVEFLAVNTDLQSLQQSSADVTLHIGAQATRGLGSGSNPELGREAALEEFDKVKALLKGS